MQILTKFSIGDHVATRRQIEDNILDLNITLKKIYEIKLTPRDPQISDTPIVTYLTDSGWITENNLVASEDIFPVALSILTKAIEKLVVTQGAK